MTRKQSNERLNYDAEEALAALSELSTALSEALFRLPTNSKEWKHLNQCLVECDKAKLELVMREVDEITAKFKQNNEIQKALEEIRIGTKQAHKAAKSIAAAQKEVDSVSKLLERLGSIRSLLTGSA